MKILIGLGVVGVALAIVAFIPVSIESDGQTGGIEEAPVLDLSEYSDESPQQSLRILFIHHSVGGQLLAPEGEAVTDEDSRAIYESHPNGGNLRALLTDAGYEVHELSYDSEIGEDTDLEDWLPKFRNDMDRILRTDRQDTLYTDGRQNDIVVFKSCYPNSEFVGEGTSPGDPESSELTVWNTKAAFNELLPLFAEHPDVLFVYMTAPPVAQPVTSIPLWKWAASRVLGRTTYVERMLEEGRLARQFNDWVRSPRGWTADYPNRNVVVFDYFDLLTGRGVSNFLQYTTNPDDSHPSAEGQRVVAAAFLPFLNRAVHRAKGTGDMALDEVDAP